jgi:2-succinyl-5-enolpyruvyl-6-hydroxy-3-cyclohexene-1-carboxylate synthase
MGPIFAFPTSRASASRSTSSRSRGTGSDAARVPFATVDPTNRNTALASAFVEELARCGVRHAILAPGSRSTPIALALWRAPAIETRVIVDERSAGYFALGAAQATRTPAAVLCTSGTAAANLHPAVCEADEAGVPLIVLTADRPPELRGIGAGQTIDQLKLYGSAVRWFCEAGTHEADDAGLLHMRSTACRAYLASRGDPRPGPVHVNLSWRDPLGPEPRPDDVTATSSLALDGRRDRWDREVPLTAIEGGPPLPGGALGMEIATRIRDAPRGLIVCGRLPGPWFAEAIAALARAAGYPILAEPTSHVRLGPHDRDLVVWAYDAIARARPEGLAPDLVIRFGDMPTSKALRLWLADLGRTRQIIVDPAFGWNEPTRGAETVVRADVASVANGVAARLDRGADDEWGGADDEWGSAWAEASGAAAAAIEAELSALDEPTEPGAHRALADLYEDGDLVYTASSMPIRDQEAFVPSGSREVRFLCNRGANGIDGLISSGIGAAAASGRPTWIVTGDLGLCHDMNGLAALRHTNTPVRIVVLNNNGGGIFEFLPQAAQIDREEFEALLGTPLGLDLARVAAVYELPYIGVDDLARLREAASGGTALIEIPVDRRANVELHARIASRVADALAALRA